jgi:hypothetical protein
VHFAVFADLLRLVTAGEQIALFADMESLIPDSGCIGPNRSGDFEVYFMVDAPTQEVALAESENYMSEITTCAGVSLAYVLTLQAQP